MERQHQERYGELGEGYWWLAGKYRIVADLARAAFEAPVGPPARVLDLGCGPGNFLDMLAPFGRTYGTDFSVDALRYCSRRGHSRLATADFHDLPYRDDSFDLVSCIDVLEHLRDDRRAAAELARVLAPGGLLVMTVPAYQFLWGDHDELYGHFRRYRVSGLKRRLGEAGLEVLRATYFEPLYLPPLWIYRKWKRIWSRGSGLEQRDDFVRIGPRLNHLLTEALAAERFVLRRVNLPFGVTIAALARKPRAGLRAKT
jgi:SAM-dependent methyltransferase